MAATLNGSKAMLGIWSRVRLIKRVVQYAMTAAPGPSAMKDCGTAMRTSPKSDDLEPYLDAMNEPVLIQVYHLAEEDGRELCVRPSREEERTKRLFGVIQSMSWALAFKVADVLRLPLEVYSSNPINFTSHLGQDQENQSRRTNIEVTVRK